MLKLPHNKQLEQNILSYVFTLKAQDRVRTLLQTREDFFYEKDGKILYRALLKEPKESLVTLNERLKSISATQMASWLTSTNWSGGSIDIELRELEDLYIRRELMKLSVNIQEANKENEKPFKIITSIERATLKMIMGIRRQTGRAKEAYLQFKKESKGQRVMKYGMASLDKMSEGHKKGEVWVVGGATGIGKSFMAITALVHTIMDDKRVLFFSTELSAGKIYERVNRMFARLSGITDEKESAKFLSKSQNLLIYDSLFEPLEILNEVKRQKLIKGCDAIILDHIQDMAFEKEEKVIGLSKACRAFERFALRENMPMLITSQLNDSGQFEWSRKVEKIATMAFKIIGEKNDNGKWINPLQLFTTKNRGKDVVSVLEIQQDSVGMFEQTYNFGKKKDETI